MATRKRRRALTDTERAEKRAAERNLMAQAIEQLRSSEGWQRWLRVRRHFHSYSFHNQLLIAYQRPGATRVAGFRRWLSLGSGRQPRGSAADLLPAGQGLRPLPGRSTAGVPRWPGRARSSA